MSAPASSGRGTSPAVEVGREGDEALRREPVGDVGYVVGQAPPLLDDDDAGSAAGRRQRQVAVGLPAPAREGGVLAGRVVRSWRPLGGRRRIGPPSLHGLGRRHEVRAASRGRVSVARAPERSPARSGAGLAQRQQALELRPEPAGVRRGQVAAVGVDGRATDHGGAAAGDAEQVLDVAVRRAGCRRCSASAVRRSTQSRDSPAVQSAGALSRVTQDCRLPALGGGPSSTTASAAAVSSRGEAGIPARHPRKRARRPAGPAGGRGTSGFARDDQVGPRRATRRRPSPCARRTR